MMGKKLLLAALTLGLALSLVLTGCSGGVKVSNSNFVFALTADIKDLAPVLLTNAVSTTVSSQIHEALVTYEGNYELTPALATEWSVSDNGLAWTFKLRPDVKWHDGEAFTSADVKFTYELVLDPATKSLRHNNYTMISSIDTPDDLTVVFNLKEPHGPFLDKMTGIMIMAEHLNSAELLKNYNQSPIGTGPFVFEEWVPDDHVTLKANADYWNGKPAIETLTFRPIPEPSVRAMALSKGEINYASNLTAEDFATLEADKSVQTFSIPQLRFAYLGQNNQNPLFKDLKVRQAMAHAVDTATLIRDIMQGAAEPSVGPIAAISEWHNPNVKKFDYNPELSKQLLAEAGWQAGADGIVAKNGQRLSFTTRLSSGDEQMKNQAVLLQNWLKAVGIEMNLEFLDTSLFYDYLDARDYEGMMLSMGPSPDPDQFNYWHSSSINAGFNDWCYSNAEVDQLLEQGRTESDPAKRKVIYDRFQEIMAEDVAAIWLYHPNSLAAVSAGFTGMVEAPAGQYQMLYKVTVAK